MEKTSKDNIIHLEDYRARSSDGTIAKVFTGRDRGQYVRESSRIDHLEKQYAKIEIVIPDNIYSINPSFFEELLVNVILKLGKDVFRERFSFRAEGNYDFERPLTEAISRILRNHTAIG